MYGWRRRIGLIVPSVNTTMEPEFYKMAPRGVTIHTSRMMEDGDLRPESLLGMEEDVERATRELATAGVDIVVFGCTAGSFLKESKHSNEISDRIKNILKNGKPAVATAAAVIWALKLLKSKRIAVATPYREEISQKEKLFLEENGFAVTNIKGLDFSKPKEAYPLTTSSGFTHGFQIGLQEPYVAYKLAMDVNTHDSDCIFISCTNLRTIEVIEDLEKDLGKPVISSNQATLAMTLKEIGIREKIEGYGSLFEKL